MKRPLSVVCLTYIVLVLLMMKVSTRHSVDYSSENGKTIQFVACEIHGLTKR